MTRTLVFIDGRVAGSSSILSGLPAGAEWFFIDPAEDGITQIQAVLDKHGDLALVHIASHCVAVPKRGAPIVRIEARRHPGSAAASFMNGGRKLGRPVSHDDDAGFDHCGHVTQGHRSVPLADLRQGRGIHPDLPATARLQQSLIP